MGLGETQRLLARLYTDAALRERFYAAPAEVGREFGLCDAESRQLAGLSPQRVNFFAASLRHKRLQEVCELLPRTSRLLGDKLPPLFYRYAEAHLPGGAKKHLTDAIAFAAYLEHLVPEPTDLPPWLADLARYEKTCLEVRTSGARRLPLLLRVARFRYELGVLTTLEIAGADGQPTVPPPPVRPSVACWFRLTPRGRVRYASLFLPRLPGLGRFSASVALASPPPRRQR